MDFFWAHAGHSRYWLIEYDVRYTGEWGGLFSAFETFDRDWVTSYIRHFADQPGWHWWETLQHPSKTIPRERLVRSFNVIYRVSRAALEHFHVSLADGWQGYTEVLAPSLLSEAGFRLLDFGGDGEFIAPGFRNRVYTARATSSGLSPWNPAVPSGASAARAGKEPAVSSGQAAGDVGALALTFPPDGPWIREVCVDALTLF